MTTNAQPPSFAAKARLSSRAQVIARLRHPNLVRMLPLPGGAGLVPVTNDARQLSDFILASAPFKRFELEQVVRLMLDVLSGLSSLHDAMVDDEHFVHGNVCPQQIYVGEHGSAKLVPLTSWHARSSTRHEPNGYVAPELLRGEPADARADLFSVGVMLWEALSGRRLFPDGRTAAVMAMLTSNQLPKLTVPTRLIWAAPLCALVERVIALDPALRPSSAVELSNSIAKAVGKHLARVNGDSWQDEAPTPVFQPRLHLAQLRSTTPPATVLDIDTDGEVTRRAVTTAQLLQDTNTAPETPAAFAASSPPPPQGGPGLPDAPPASGWLRTSAVAVGAVAIAALAWLGFEHSGVPRTPATQPAPAGATLPAPATMIPPAAELPSLPSAAPAVMLEPPAAASSAAAPAPSVSARAKRPARALSPPKLKKPPARPAAADYGI